MAEWLREARWFPDSSSLRILQSEVQKARVELPGCVRLAAASQSLLEHSSCLLKTLQSHQGLAQAEEAPGPARSQGKGHLGIGQGPCWLTQPLMAERTVSKQPDKDKVAKSLDLQHFALP